MYNVLISAAQKIDSVTYIHIYIIFHILFHYGFSQDIEYSTLCYTVALCYLWESLNLLMEMMMKIQ